MADLKPQDRGQILLVAAFALAVTFLGLAMIANSAIYTENVATRGETVDASNALETRHQVEQSAADAIEAANWNNQTSGYSNLRLTVDESIQDLDQWAGLHAGRDGTILTTTMSGHQEGYRLVQTNGTTFETSNAGTVQSDWTVASDVDRTRAFEVAVTDVSALDTLAGTPFTVNVTNAPSRNWTMSVADGGPGDVVVEVNRESPDETAECRVPDTTPITIDVTGGTINGEPCAALTTTDGINMQYGSGIAFDYDVKFENGDAVRGNYSLIVDDGSTIPGGNYGSLGGASQPYEFPAMYSGTIQLEYHANNVDYETEIRVAPGEVDD